MYSGGGGALVKREVQDVWLRGSGSGAHVLVATPVIQLLPSLCFEVVFGVFLRSDVWSGSSARALLIGSCADFSSAHVRHTTIPAHLPFPAYMSSLSSVNRIHSDALGRCALDCSLNAKKQNVFTNRDVSADAITFLCEHVRAVVCCTL